MMSFSFKAFILALALSNPNIQGNSIPDISNIKDNDFKLHPSLGLVITVKALCAVNKASMCMYEVAYPIYATTDKLRCDVFLSLTKFNIVICSNDIEYLLRSPSIFRLMGTDDWVSMDYWGKQ